MPILINHNICDEAPECGGIAVCPNKAFYFDKKKKQVAVDKNKCKECLKCTLPDVCPVGCILYARTLTDEKRLLELFRKESYKKPWLWQERCGTQPGKTIPKAVIVTDKNFQSVSKQHGYKLIDVWHYDYLDCRLYSALFKDILKGVKQKVSTNKLDAKQFPKLTKKLKVKKFPTLILMKNEVILWKHDGYIHTIQANTINKEIKLTIKSNT